jgi:hypothetical protein
MVDHAPRSVFCSLCFQHLSAMAFSCPLGSDDRFGPRVTDHCRSFDFTLLFEDVFFALLPAAVFLVSAILRLPLLLRAPVKVTSHHLATAKLVTILLNPLSQCIRAKQDHRSPSRACSLFTSHFWLSNYRLQFYIPKLHSQPACYSCSPLLFLYCCHGWRISAQSDHQILWSYTSSCPAYSQPPE